MIVELRSLYRGQDTASGLEILIWGMYSGQTQVVFLATEIDGNVIEIPRNRVRLNWRWNGKTGDWDDLDEQRAKPDVEPF